MNDNFSKIDIGDFSNNKTEVFTHKILGNVKGKNFLKDKLNLSGMEVSLNVLPAKAAVPFYHIHHDNEELYLFIKGQGQFQVDGTSFNIQEGSIVRVAPEGVRTWRNTSEEDLHYIVIQAKANSLQGGTTTDGAAVNKEVVWPDSVAELA